MNGSNSITHAAVLPLSVSHNTVKSIYINASAMTEKMITDFGSLSFRAIIRLSMEETTNIHLG